MKKKSILFVCLGNICRSPTAHAVFEKFVQDSAAKDNIFVDSDLRPKFESVVQMAAPGTTQTTKTQRVPPNAILVDYEDGKYYFKVPGRRDFLITDGYK